MDVDAKAKKNDFEALFKRIFKRKISTVKIAKIYSQITIAAWMQPLQYDLRCSAAKDNSITHAAAAPSNLDAHYNAICRHWVAKHNRTTRDSIGNCSSKTGCRRQSKKNDFEALFKRKISTVKIAKIYSQITIAWMQPLQYDLRCSAAKDNSITHAAAAPSNVEHTRCRAPASSPKHSPCNIHAAITMRSATTASGNA